MMSEPRRRKGSARCCILFGGPTLRARSDGSAYAMMAGDLPESIERSQKVRGKVQLFPFRDDRSAFSRCWHTGQAVALNMIEHQCP